MTSQPRSLGELARLCGAELRNAGGDELVTGVAPLDTASRAQLSFFSNVAYRGQLSECQAAAIIVSVAHLDQPALEGRALLIVGNPYAAFARISAAFHPRPTVVAGIDSGARVEAGATVDPTARVEAFAFVGAGASIGPGAVVMSGAYVGVDARIGADTTLHPRVVVGERCLVGDRCIIHAGVVIGADGFGFAFDPEGDGAGPIHRKIPQVGIVRIEDDVEIGANCCIDRATFGETVIGFGSKLDNLIQIAHNVTLGPLCIIAAQSGIAGSSKVGAGVAMGGQSAIAGHLKVGDMARLGARAGVTQDVPAGAVVSGFPAVEHKLWLRAVTAFPRLPELLRDVRRLRKHFKSETGDT